MRNRSRPPRDCAYKLVRLYTEISKDQAIAVCYGDPRAAVRALIVANSLLESEMADLKKAVSHAYMHGRFRTCAG